MCILCTRKPDLVGESSCVENLLTRYWRSECCMCLCCILQFHLQHMAFWVNVWMATLYRWKQSPRHWWSPSYIITRWFGCHQPAQAVLRHFWTTTFKLRVCTCPVSVCEKKMQIQTRKSMLGFFFFNMLFYWHLCWKCNLIFDTTAVRRQGNYWFKKNPPDIKTSSWALRWVVDIS